MKSSLFDGLQPVTLSGVSNAQGLSRPVRPRAGVAVRPLATRFDRSGVEVKPGDIVQYGGLDFEVFWYAGLQFVLRRPIAQDSKKRYYTVRAYASDCQVVIMGVGARVHVSEPAQPVFQNGVSK